MEKKVAILGAGQLAKYLVWAAAKLQLPVTVVATSPTEPACQESYPSVWVEKQWTPELLLKVFQTHDWVTFENEWISDALLEAVKKASLLDRFRPFYSSMNQVRTKWDQKRFFQTQGFPTARAISGECLDLTSPQKLLHSLPDDWELGIVVKESELAYDGKGVFVFESPKAEAKKNPAQGKKTLEALLVKLKELKQNQRPFYLEEKIGFTHEMAIVFARSEASPKVVTYPLVQFTTRQGICDTVFVDQEEEASFLEIRSQAVHLAQGLAQKLDWRGCGAIEFFYSDHLGLMINEIAPRVHNSGHYTLTACQVSQFENHLRGITDLPLIEPITTPFAMMKNLLGPVGAQRSLPPVTREKEEPGRIEIFWYGKKEIRPGRKMGHINASGNQDQKTSLIKQVETLVKQWEENSL